MAQQFFARILHWVANEIVVEKLANSRSFQRFAVRTADSIEKAKAMTAEKLQQSIEDVPRMVKDSMQKPPQRQVPRPGGVSFFDALKEEIAKDFGKGGRR